MAFRGKRALIPAHSYAPSSSEDDDDSDEEQQQDQQQQQQNPQQEARNVSAPPPKFGGKGFAGKGANLMFNSYNKKNPNLKSDDEDDDEDASDGSEEEAQQNLTIVQPNAQHQNANIQFNSMQPNPQYKQMQTPGHNRPTYPDAKSIPQNQMQQQPIVKLPQNAGVRAGNFPGKGAALMRQLQTHKKQDSESEDESEYDEAESDEDVNEKRTMRHPQEAQRQSHASMQNDPGVRRESGSYNVSQHPMNTASHDQQYYQHLQNVPLQQQALYNLNLQNTLLAQQQQQFNAMRQNSFNSIPGNVSGSSGYNFNHLAPIAPSPPVPGANSNANFQQAYATGQGHVQPPNGPSQSKKTNAESDEKKRKSEEKRLAREAEKAEKKRKREEEKTLKKADQEEKKRKLLEQKHKHDDEVKARLAADRRRQAHLQQAQLIPQQTQPSNQISLQPMRNAMPSVIPPPPPSSATNGNVANNYSAVSDAKMTNKNSNADFSPEELYRATDILTDVQPFFSKMNKLKGWMEDNAKTDHDVIAKISIYLLRVGEFITGLRPPIDAVFHHNPDRMKAACWEAASRMIATQPHGSELAATYSQLLQEFAQQDK